MLKKPLSSLTRAAFAAVVFSAVSSVANAVSVFTPFGDPFPTGSTIIVGPGFTTDLGYVPYMTLSNFHLQTFSTAGGNQTFVYTVDLYNAFLDAPGGNQVGSQQGASTDFTATLSGRSGLFESGTFNLVLDNATFTTLLSPSGGNALGRLNPALVTSGAVTFTGPVTVGGVPGLLADTSYILNSQYSVNGGPFITVPPLNATSSPLPPTAVPEPATAALVIPGLLAMLGVRRRRAATVA